MGDYIYKWKSNMFTRFTVHTQFCKFDKDEVEEVRKQDDGSWIIQLKGHGTCYVEGSPVQVIAIP